MLKLPDRVGPKPTTSAGIPHRQLDQTPSSALYERLAARLQALPNTEHGASLISVPGARAMFLSACPRCNLRYGFLRGREFAHLHPPQDGSLHMTLAPDDAAQVLARGWGELHPLATTGRVLPTVVMVYAPRDHAEVDAVLSIVEASLNNARTVSALPESAQEKSP